VNKLNITVLAAILGASIIGAAIFLASSIEKRPVDAKPIPCNNCAQNFAPGQEAEDPTGAKDFVPGHCIGCDPKDDAPGQLDKKPIPE
jgi:hypothetical protein